MFSNAKKPLIAILMALALALPASAALAGSPSAGATADGVVNINEATATQLAYLPGIGPSKAERIVAYRAKYRFKKVLEIARVRGIGLKTAHKLKGWLRVDGPTTVDAPIRVAKKGDGGGER